MSNWKLVIRREAAGAAVLWAATCDKKAALPEELFGLPVTALGDHAFTPGRPAPEGERVLITCGPEDGEWDNRRLEDLALPSALTRAEDYAFFNCAAIKTMRLADGLCHWGGGALMNCRCLDTFHLTCTGREGEVLAYLADELPRELDVTLHRAGGECVRLIFPEYVELFEENIPAHHFDYEIYGAGYPYHHCFHRRQLDIRAYDALWKDYLATEHNPLCALRLAWWRLRYPVELTEQAEGAYLGYLRRHAARAARWRISERDAAGVRFLLEKTEPDRAMLRALCDLARDLGNTEALALLLEEQHRRFPAGLEKTFEL